MLESPHIIKLKDHIHSILEHRHSSLQHKADLIQQSPLNTVKSEHDVDLACVAIQGGTSTAKGMKHLLGRHSAYQGLQLNAKIIEALQVKPYLEKSLKEVEARLNRSLTQTECDLFEKWFIYAFNF